MVDGVVPPGPEPGFLKHMDLHMLVLVGGKERTEDEWRDLLAAEAFEIARITQPGRRTSSKSGPSDRIEVEAAGIEPAQDFRRLTAHVPCLSGFS